MLVGEGHLQGVGARRAEGGGGVLGGVAAVDAEGHRSRRGADDGPGVSQAGLPGSELIPPLQAFLALLLPAAILIWLAAMAYLWEKGGIESNMPTL